MSEDSQLSSNRAGDKEPGSEGGGVGGTFQHIEVPLEGELCPMDNNDCTATHSPYSKHAVWSLSLRHMISF